MKRPNIIATLLLVAGLVGCDVESTTPSQQDHEFEAQAVSLPAEAQIE